MRHKGMEQLSRSSPSSVTASGLSSTPRLPHPRRKGEEG